MGLLLLRLAQAVSSLLDVRLYPWESGDAVALATLCTQLLASGLVALGLWTRMAGVLLAVLEAYRVTVGGSVDGRPAVVAVIGVSLVMLGPGAWSIDARLFGRRRINL